MLFLYIFSILFWTLSKIYLMCWLILKEIYISQIILDMIDYCCFIRILIRGFRDFIFFPQKICPCVCILIDLFWRGIPCFQIMLMLGILREMAWSLARLLSFSGRISIILQYGVTSWLIDLALWRLPWQKDQNSACLSWIHRCGSNYCWWVRFWSDRRF